MFGAALAHHVLESVGLGVPERAFYAVLLADAPVVRGVLDARLETLQLFRGVYVQMELEDGGPVVL